MAIKKRSKVNAQFNMSSLTDIIFLLLIFFMLTSSLVNPNALNLKIPGVSKNNKTTLPSKNDTPQVVITERGKFKIGSKTYSNSQIQTKLRQYRKKTIIIAPNKKAPVEGVARIMDIAMQYHIDAILAADD